MPDHRHLIIIAALSPCFTCSALADLLEPAPVDAGPFNLVPALGIRQIYDDNFYRQEGDDSEAFHVQALDFSLDAIALDGPHEYRARYQADAGFIDQSSDDNYIDQSARFQGKWEMAIRHRLELRGAYEELHDRRGTGYFQGNQALAIDEPARYRRESAMARYIYGADQARGQLQFELNALNKTYLNFREQTQANDLVHAYGTTTFLWRVVGSLRGLLEVNHGDLNYQNDPASQAGVEDNLDSQHTEYLAGLTWEITGQTTGTVKAGHATKDFTDADRQDFSGSSWSGEIEWWPRSYSRLSLMTGRHPEETTGSGDFVDTYDLRLRWEHDWNNRLESRLGVLRRDEQYEADPAGREDNTTRYNAELDYAMRRWLVIGIFYDNEKRDSSLAEFTYAREVAGLSLNMSL